jgi:hypothetical protein
MPHQPVKKNYSTTLLKHAIMLIKKAAKIAK